MSFGFPGIGGSLGCCAVCGVNFLTAMFSDEPVQRLRIDGIAEDMAAHLKCVPLLQQRAGERWRELPDASPIRKAFLDAESEAA